MMPMPVIEFHPTADIFPLLEGAAFDSLVADIKANGLLQPIELTADGRILDGRNRYRACIVAGITPRFENHTGSDLVQHVISRNLLRRHLDESQRAMVAARLATLRHGQRKSDSSIDLSQSDAAAMVNVGVASVKRARTVLEDGAPELISAVERGEIAVSLAVKIAEEDAGTQRKILTVAEDEAINVAIAHRVVRENRRRESAEGRARAHWVVTDDQAVVSCAPVVTDPPYGILDEPWEPARLEPFTRDWLRRWNSSGADVLLSFWSQWHLFDGRRWFDEELTEYRFQQVLVWVHRNNTKYQGRMGFIRTWDPILFYRKRGSEREIVVGDGVWGDELHNLDSHLAAIPQSKFGEEDMKVHPAQKPVSVMRWLVNAVTRPGELVVDPFCGSGTTGIASVQLGRRFHGIETSGEFRKIAEGRIALYGIGEAA